MTHEEFMERLCFVISAFMAREYGENMPCFCGEGEIAKIEIERGVWRCSPTILQCVADKLGILLPCPEKEESDK